MSAGLCVALHARQSDTEIPRLLQTQRPFGMRSGDNCEAVDSGEVGGVAGMDGETIL